VFEREKTVHALDRAPTVIGNYITQPVEKNAWSSGTCSLGTKRDMRLLFALFYSAIAIVFYHSSGEVVRCQVLHNEVHL
jgi:hypothetical protein